MNLTQSVGLQALRDGAVSPLLFGKKDRQQVAHLLADAEDWLVSREFFLMDVPLHFASTPLPVPRNAILAQMHASSDSDAGVLIDVNHRQVGRIQNSYAPPVIVLAGQASVQAARLLGRERIRAWIGNLAAAKVKLIHADHQFGSSELNQKLQNVLNESLGIDDSSGLPSVVGTLRPYVREVYPYEGYFIYDLAQQTYKQKFTTDLEARTVELTGVPVPVKQKYVSMKAGKARMAPRSGMGMESAAVLYAGGPGSSLGQGSGPVASRFPRGNNSMMADFSGIPAPQRTTEEQARKSRGASNSEMAKKLAKNNKPGQDPTDDVDAEEECPCKHKGKMKGSGYVGYRRATGTQQEKVRGPHGSEMFSRLKANMEDPNVVSKMVARFTKACKAGWKMKKGMEGSAPPGYEPMVMKLKEKYGTDSDVPYKIAWWHHGGGNK